MSEAQTQRIVAALLDDNPDAVLFDNMHAALIGVARRGHLEPVAAYSRAGLLRKLLADGFSREDADEYFDKFVNVWAGEQGEQTPVIVDDLAEE